MDTNLFFPISSTSAFLADTAKAKGVCHACPVQSECLRLATDLVIEDGIWGGLTASERRTTKRRPAKTRLTHYR